MSKAYENIELNRGFKEYNAKIKDLEGIFEKLQSILNITEYQKELEQIKQDVANESSLSTEMMSESMKLEYEDIVLNPYTNRLDELLNKIKEQNLESFYELHLLTTKVNLQISSITNENIAEIIEKTKEIVKLVNSLNTHNDKLKNKLIEEAYKTIYSVIMYEEMFNRNDIFTYIKYINSPANIENLGRLLAKDLQVLSTNELIDEDLQNIKTQGLGYDYFNEEIIRKISRKTVGESNSEYQQRKKQAIDSLSTKVQEFSAEKSMLNDALKSINNSINKLKIQKSLLVAKILSLVLVPVITFSSGNLIGKNLSNKITEYSTITRTIDLNTGKVIGDPTEVYDEKETTYVATIMVYSPWKINPTGQGYISNVTAYEYIVPENIPDDYHITINDIKDNLIKKYEYVEPKEKLDSIDSTTEPTLLMTETYQDKSKTQKSTKYILPGTIAGTLIGIGIDTLLILFAKFGIMNTLEELEIVNKKTKKQKANKKEIKANLTTLKDRIAALQDEYNLVVKNYGMLGDSLIIPEIDESWINSFTKKKIK